MARKRNYEEDDIQASIIDLLKVAAINDLMYFSVPNGGKRDIRTAVILKDTGQKPGVPDLVFIHPHTHRGHFLEVKTPKGSLSKHQRDFRDICKLTGVPWGLARSRDQAQDILTNWGMIRSNYGRRIAA
jgi:hypothetical protein